MDWRRGQIRRLIEIIIHSNSNTVKGGLSVAKFLVNCFKREPFQEVCGCARPVGCTLRYLPPCSLILFPPRQSQLVHASHDHGAASGCCIASFDQDITRRGLKTKLIASEALCSVRAIHRIA